MRVDDELERGQYERTGTILLDRPKRRRLLCKVFQSQGIFPCSLIFALFILMCLIAALYVQTGGGPSKSGFGCDLQMSPPYVSDRVVNTNNYCVNHLPLNNINQNLFLKIISENLDSTIRFLAVGDFGRDGFCCQLDVGWEIARAAGGIKPSFITNLGDAFYEYGLKSEKEEQVDTSWKNVYMGHEELKSIPWYSILGNHEYRGSAEAVLKIPTNRYPLFVINNRFYDQLFTSADGTFQLHVFFLDTSPMINAYRQPGYDDHADTMLHQPDGISTQWDLVQHQLNWLDEGLRLTTARIKVVVGHHPPYTSGSHFGEDQGFLRENLVPILERNLVSAYFSGHDHNLQEYWKLSSPTHYFVSAGGSKVEGAFSRRDDYMRYFDQVNGFCAIEASIHGLKVAFVDYVGNVIRTVDIPIDSKS